MVAKTQHKLVLRMTNTYFNKYGRLWMIVDNG